MTSEFYINKHAFLETNMLIKLWKKFMIIVTNKLVQRHGDYE